MKKQLFKKSLVAMLSIAVLMSACKKEENETTQEEEEIEVVVSVPDTRLATQIKTRLKLGANDNITSKNILLLDTLKLDAETDVSETGVFKEIASLTGLESASNLVYLHLGYTKVTDLTPIKDLKKVKYLRLNNTAVSSLSPIANYTSLTYFNANQARSIIDISPLSKNLGLQEIILRQVAFGNAGMATFTNMTKLYRLNIRETNISDISVIGQLMAKGAFLKTTEGATAAGGDAVIDMRGLTVSNCNVLDAYIDTRVKLEGACLAR